MDFDFEAHWKESIKQDKEELAWAKEQVRYWKGQIERTTTELALDEKRLADTLSRKNKQPINEKGNQNHETP